MQSLRLLTLAGLSAGVVFALFGCANAGMDEVDRRIAAMMQNRSTETDSNKSPQLDFNQQQHENDDAKVRKESLSTDPPTTNPLYESLRYKTDTEARDVSAKLNSYADEAYGTDTEGAGLKNAVQLNLMNSWRATQVTCREFLTAEEDYMIAVIRLLQEQHRWEPRFFNDTTLGLSNGWTAGSSAPALNAINTLKVQQKLPYGGQAEAAWIASAGQQLRDAVTGGYSQSSALQFSANVPLLRGAGEVAREPLIQSERNLIYQARTFERFRRQLLVNIAGDYFQLVQTQSLIANQQRSLQGLRTFQEATQARVDAGRIAAFQVNIAANDVLNAEAQLANLREQYILQLDRFKVRLGMDVSEKVVIRPLALEVPVPDTTLAQATWAALEYRLDLQNTRDRVDDARRAVANAQNDTLPSLNVGGNAVIRTDPRNDVSSLGFSPDDTTVTGTATLSLPLDNQIERLTLRSATINLRQQERAYEQARDNVVVSVRSALRSIDLAAFRLKLAEEQVEINKRRLEEQLLKIDEVDAKAIVDSQNALLDSENRRDQARTDLRNAVLNYLLESDQLRVTPEGTFQPLPGMVMPNPADAAPPGTGDAPPMGNQEDVRKAMEQGR